MQKHPHIPCPYTAEPECDERGPMRSKCVNGRIVHFITGDEMDCHLCRGKGTIRDPATYICNACGGSLLPTFPEWWLKQHGDKPDHARCFPHGLVDARVTGGYDSEHIFDLTTYEWSMCEKCLRTMFNGFKIPPHVSDALHGETDSYDSDRKHWEFRMWERSGKALAWARSGRCNGALECPHATTHRRYTSGQIDGDASRCDEHADVGLCLNVESISFAEVPALTTVRFFGIEEFDFGARTYPWSSDERAAIDAGARAFETKNGKRMAEMDRTMKEEREA